MLAPDPFSTQLAEHCDLWFANTEANEMSDFPYHLLGSDRGRSRTLTPLVLTAFTLPPQVSRAPPLRTVSLCPEIRNFHQTGFPGVEQGQGERTGDLEVV